MDQAACDGCVHQHFAPRPDAMAGQSPDNHDESCNGEPHRHKTEWLCIGHGKPSPDEAGGPEQNKHEGEKAGSHDQKLFSLAPALIRF